ncbi:hypothetical protein T281_16020 [Rhodomicrobium udaipurense JA643]|uniref:Uncharacterized protein n=1 Tax=Rhodomicrobium udaipurense TaxID=1202716 RepID=A0A8I1GEG4_9HYPH|nr:hypothetical protein [Rhodomicrobium udaipurense]KAI93542.1 hypothetical protein T281_16020 [Rhodomicrobium udaipurense JA643]MBJ7543284.1 hypothetical protein [Rhodomicrobium udaipurense]
MNVIFAWFLRRLTAWGLGGVSDLLSAGIANFLEPLAKFALALIRGLLEIVVDLSKSFEGRMVLAGIVFGLGGWYAYETYTIRPQDEVAALEQRVRDLEKRPASCPQAPKARPQR